MGTRVGLRYILSTCVDPLGKRATLLMAEACQIFPRTNLSKGFRFYGNGQPFSLRVLCKQAYTLQIYIYIYICTDICIYVYGCMQEISLCVSIYTHTYTCTPISPSPKPEACSLDTLQPPIAEVLSGGRHALEVRSFVGFGLRV